MFDPTKPVQTRDGRKARILCTDFKMRHYPIIAAITDSDGKEYLATYSVSGVWKGAVVSRDLVNVPPRHKHADIMIAYANNSSLVIEFRRKPYLNWEVTMWPTFDPNYEYRIKPEGN